MNKFQAQRNVAAVAIIVLKIARIGTMIGISALQWLDILPRNNGNSRSNYRDKERETNKFRKRLHNLHAIIMPNNTIFIGSTAIYVSLWFVINILDILREQREKKSSRITHLSKLLKRNFGMTKQLDFYENEKIEKKHEARLTYNEDSSFFILCITSEHFALILLILLIVSYWLHIFVWSKSNWEFRRLID